MLMNHHILAKTTTDAILKKYKSEEWLCGNNLGKDFYRVTTDASFPSLDASFYDDLNKFLVSFEFKPPTETKRGILTGVGQSIAYLQESNVSFLIAPQFLEDFRLGEYLLDLFKNQIFGKLPIGLILYENNRPEIVTLASDIDLSILSHTTSNFKSRSITSSRYWAKHQDLPLGLFHLLLHCYFLKKSNAITVDPFQYCWTHYMISPTILEDFMPKQIRDCNGDIIKTPAGTKPLMMLEKILHRSADMGITERRNYIQTQINTNFTGDNKYQAYRKNFVSFLKNLRVIDSVHNLTESGFKLYSLGLTNGPSSKIFQDYFIKEVLTTGHHLDLIFDLDYYLRKSSASFNEILSQMESDYEEKGFIKRNPNRRASTKSNVNFLKYECILWRSLGLLKGTNNNYSVDWKLITSVCGLPEL